jgi:hypothetical protein
MRSRHPMTFGNQRQRADALRHSNDLWVLQPQINPKYHYHLPIFNNLAFSEAPSMLRNSLKIKLLRHSHPK